MKKLPILCILLMFFGFAGSASALTYNATAGDQDYAYDRDAYDVATNMDHYVFRTNSGISSPYTNSLGWIAWNYTLPNELLSALSGSMTIQAWDIDASDVMEVFFNFGSSREYAGTLSGSDGGNVSTWNTAAANGTTASLGGWSLTTFNFSTGLLNALTNSSGFYLELDVQNAASSWAAVIDYATIRLDFEPGAPLNPVPEPTTMLLMALGLIGIAGARKRINK